MEWFSWRSLLVKREFSLHTIAEKLLIGYFSIVCVFSLNIVGSFSFYIKCLKATATGNWRYINKTEMNLIKNRVEPQSLLQPGEAGSKTV